MVYLKISAVWSFLIGLAFDNRIFCYGASASAWEDAACKYAAHVHGGVA